MLWRFCNIWDDGVPFRSHERLASAAVTTLDAVPDRGYFVCSCACARYPSTPPVISVVVRRHGVEFSWLGIGVLVCVLYAILYYVSAKSLNAALKAVPEINRDLRALDGPVQCAVFVELSVGIRERGLDGKREDVQLGKRLKEVLEANNSGWYADQLTIPECTTMILYGSDADTLFQAIEPTLRSEPICAGARITIRQRDGQREAMLPSRLT